MTGSNSILPFPAKGAAILPPPAELDFGRRFAARLRVDKLAED